MACGRFVEGNCDCHKPREDEFTEHKKRIQMYEAGVLFGIRFVLIQRTR